MIIQIITNRNLPSVLFSFSLDCAGLEKVKISHQVFFNIFKFIKVTMSNKKYKNCN